MLELVLQNFGSLAFIPLEQQTSKESPECEKVKQTPKDASRQSDKSNGVASAGPLPPTNSLWRCSLCAAALSPASSAHGSKSPLVSPCYMGLSREPKLCPQQGRSPRDAPQPQGKCSALDAPQAPQIFPWPWTAAPVNPLPPMIQLPAWKSYLSGKETEKDRELG